MPNQQKVSNANNGHQFQEIIRKPKMLLVAGILIILLALSITLWYKKPIQVLKQLSSTKSPEYGVSYNPPKFKTAPIQAPVVFEVEKGFVVSGKIAEVAKDFSWIKLTGASNTTIKTKLNCGEKLNVMFPRFNKKESSATAQALRETDQNSSFFGICRDKVCSSISNCTLIKI